MPSTESFNIESGALLSLPTILFMFSINVLGIFALLRLLIKTQLMPIHQMCLSTIYMSHADKEIFMQSKSNTNQMCVLISLQMLM